MLLKLIEVGFVFVICFCCPKIFKLYQFQNFYSPVVIAVQSVHLLLQIGFLLEVIFLCLLNVGIESCELRFSVCVFRRSGCSKSNVCGIRGNLETVFALWWFEKNIFRILRAFLTIHTTKVIHVAKSRCRTVEIVRPTDCTNFSRVKTCVVPYWGQWWKYN